MEIIHHEEQIARDREYEQMLNEQQSKCPHGRDWAECDDCMIRSDQANDASREK